MEFWQLVGLIFELGGVGGLAGWALVSYRRLEREHNTVKVFARPARIRSKGQAGTVSVERDEPPTLEERVSTLESQVQRLRSDHNNLNDGLGDAKHELRGKIDDLDTAVKTRIYQALREIAGKELASTRVAWASAFAILVGTFIQVIVAIGELKAAMAAAQALGS